MSGMPVDAAAVQNPDMNASWNPASSMSLADNASWQHGPCTLHVSKASTNDNRTMGWAEGTPDYTWAHPTTPPVKLR